MGIMRIFAQVNFDDVVTDVTFTYRHRLHIITVKIG